jgi:ABC-type Fe3+/spermidine/putrescine transport system ATPase subunit
MAGIRVERLSKAFAGQTVLDVEELEISDGEFFSLLGPSGCGKTTTLRCIAGSMEPDGGRILIGGRDVHAVPTHRRNLGMVFQSYALFPHMTVAANVGYGLEERGVSRVEVRRKVAEFVELVGLRGFESRYPHQLSGGQQQRVALARALVYHPDVLLLDEPFSSLDVKLRVSMRAELKRVQQALAVTTIFVTHDQQEALSLSDRIAVLNAGRVEQVGTPDRLYEAPGTLFVADFMGSTNLLAGRVEDVDGQSGAGRIRLQSGHMFLANECQHLSAGDVVQVSIKPERVQLEPCCDGPNIVSGEVIGIYYLGAAYSYVVRVGTQPLEARSADPVAREGRRLALGDTVALGLPAASLRVFRT